MLCVFAELDDETELEELEEFKLLEEDELDKLEELDELLDELLMLEELTPLDKLDEPIGGELELPPPPHAVSNNEKTRGAIKCTRVN